MGNGINYADEWIKGMVLAVQGFEDEGKAWLLARLRRELARELVGLSDDPEVALPYVAERLQMWVRLIEEVQDGED